MINVDEVVELAKTAPPREPTQEEMEAMRQTAINALINNQECYVAQWILQNPYARISDYQLVFAEGQPGEIYRVSMEKKTNV